MRKPLFLASAIAIAGALSAPANAVPVPANSSLIPTQPFDASTQGSVLTTTSVSGQSLTFGTTLRSAVYRNTLGTLDFYYQVLRTGAGTAGDDPIDRLTSSSFLGYTVDAFAFAADPDGTGFFTAAANAPPAGQAPGSTTTFGRDVTGGILQTSFGSNGLALTESSATYIFRTNAATFGQGFFGVSDGTTFSGLAFAPTGAPVAPVPEPATWAMMLVGFGAVGFGLRRRKALAPSAA